jgi:predicted lipoprotein with Yx(FWY)xxD motif
MRSTTGRRTAARRTQVAAVLAATVALGVTTVSAATSATAGAAKATAKPTVSIARTQVGPLLVDSSQNTVYMWVRDKHNKDMCIPNKKCEKDWPAVTTPTKPVAGPGVKKSLLGWIPFKGPHKGTLYEATYKGQPLHTYRFDTGKRSVINIGNRQFGGAWYALNAKGQVVK